MAWLQLYCWRFAVLLNKCYLKWGILPGAGWFPKQECAFVWPVINWGWMFLSCAAHMLSLSQADEWLWPLFIITTWLEEIMTGMFLQASLYARYWSQSFFSSHKKSVFQVKKREHFWSMQFILHHAEQNIHVQFSQKATRRRVCENCSKVNLVARWRWFVRLTPASACDINSVHITTGCCMPLNRKEIIFLGALELKTPTSACFQPNRLLQNPYKYNANSGLSHTPKKKCDF